MFYKEIIIKKAISKIITIVEKETNPLGWNEIVVSIISSMKTVAILLPVRFSVIVSS